MRVFWLSGLVDIPSDRMYVRTIHLSRCMDRCSRYRGANLTRDRVEIIQKFHIITYIYKYKVFLYNDISIINHHINIPFRDEWFKKSIKPDTYIIQFIKFPFFDKLNPIGP